MARKWREANPERAREADRRKRENKPELYRELTKQAMRAKRARDPEAARESGRAWRKANPDKVRAYSAAHRAADPEKARAATRAWQKKNPHIVNAHTAKRKARIRGAKIVERIDRHAIYDRDGGRCHLCGELAPREDFTLDHLIPVVLGGNHTQDNVKVAHGVCNSRKGARFIST